MIRAVWTIARRDITATILSRGFLVWLAMPVIGLVFGLLASLASDRPAPSQPMHVAVIDRDGGLAPWLQTTAARETTRGDYERLRGRWRAARGDAAYPDDLARPAALLADSELDALAPRLADVSARHDLGLGDLDAAIGTPSGPRFTRVAAMADAAAQTARLLRDGGRFDAVLIVDGDRPRLMTRGRLADAERVRTLVGLALTKRALAVAGLDTRLDRVRRQAPDIAVETIASHAGTPARGGGSALATGATTALFALISLLAGALLSNMVEEKSNKIIEVLVASVPIPAIYAGKLIAMLTVSLIGIAVWGLMFGGGIAVAAAQLPDGLIPTPARGWPELVALGLAYFVCAYLIYGALYLGIGSLCSSIREVQTLSMPVTILQMVVLIVTLGALGNDGTWAGIVAWFPLSAPYMMIGRAAIGIELGVHIAAIAWQLGFAALVIAGSARLFRQGVLHSGPPPTLRQLARLLRTVAG
jgi:ABC-2 type transport system permease protein